MKQSGWAFFPLPFKIMARTVRRVHNLSEISSSMTRLHHLTPAFPSAYLSGNRKEELRAVLGETVSGAP